MAGGMGVAVEPAAAAAQAARGMEVATEAVATEAAGQGLMALEAAAALILQPMPTIAQQAVEAPPSERQAARLRCEREHWLYCSKGSAPALAALRGSVSWGSAARQGSGVAVLNPTLLITTGSRARRRERRGSCGRLRAIGGADDEQCEVCEGGHAAALEVLHCGCRTAAAVGMGSWGGCTFAAASRGSSSSNCRRRA